jgi:hypothetical protein
MASAWGLSWGSAWGVSWDFGTTPPVTNLHGRPIRPRRWRGPEYEEWIRQRVERGDLPGLAAGIKEQIEVAQADVAAGETEALEAFAGALNAARGSLVAANYRFGALVEMVLAAHAEQMVRDAELQRAVELAAFIQRDEEEAAFLLLFQ